MARPLRIEFDGAWYHVMNRGLEKRVIFRDDEDCQIFLNLLGDISETFGVEVHAYSLMPNHYHLLLHTPQAGYLSRAMRHLNGLYTQKFNKKWHRDGPLFRGRYKSVVADEAYLPELAEYIHLNPVKAGITTFAGKHLWTSDQFYHSSKKAPAWLATTILQSKVRPTSAVLNDSKISSHKISFGQKGFQEWLRQNHLTQKQKNDVEIPARKKLSPQRPSAKQILEIVSLAFDKSIAQIRTASTATRTDRSIAIYLLRKLAGLPQKDIAKWMRVSNAYAVAKSQQRLQEKLLHDKKLKKTVAQLQKTILSTVKT